MKNEQVFNVVKKAILETLEGVDESSLKLETSLESLGADSINKVEIATIAMKALNKKIPRSDLGNLKTINDFIKKLE